MIVVTFSSENIDLNQQLACGIDSPNAWAMSASSLGLLARGIRPANLDLSQGE